MSLRASWGSNTAKIASAAGAVQPYATHVFVYVPESATASATAGIISSAVSDSSVNNRDYMALLNPGSDPTGNCYARSSDNAGSTAGATDGPVNRGAWTPILGAFQANNFRFICAHGDPLTAVVQTNSKSITGTIAHTRMGAWEDNTVQNSEIYYAEFTRWDTTGFTQQDLEDLAVRLGTAVGGVYPNPLTVNEDVGEPWTGKLVRYWRLTDTDDAVDLMGSGDDWQFTGTITNVAEHPNIAPYSQARVVPDMPALILGATTFANLTDVEYLVTDGHADIAGTELASGTDMTTDTNGVPVFPGTESIGVVDGPMTVHIYFEIGADKHSVIHKVLGVEA